MGEINGKPIIYYATGATASDQRLLDDAFGSKETCGTVSEYLLSQKVKLHRITPTDRGMMDVLVAELGLRQVEKSDHVLILSEWDSFYGRAMPTAFKNAWAKDDKGQKVVQVFGYMRGLDGKLPDKGDKAAVADKKPDSKDKSEVAASIESPEGQSQKDYLRRLADHIVGLDQDFKNQGHSKGVAAIGVLGSDVHDKLMILEALRQYFPHKLFFTTDLDAAYNHPSKRRQTHNLLVASAFDLQLRSELQGNIPPFRDAYQTAMFLATQLVVNADRISPEQIELRPRLFEIGRNHPIPLPTSEGNLTVMLKDDMDNCSWKEWQNCKNVVHPKDLATSQFQLTWKNGLFAVDLIVAIAFLYFVYPLFRKWAKNAYDYCKSNIIRMIKVTGGFLVVCCLVIFAWCFYSSQYYAEPFYWFEGVSIWPSQLLRLLIVPVAWGFWFRGDLRIKGMQAALQKEDGGDKTFALRDQPNATILGYWDGVFVGNWKKEEGNSQTVDPETLWKKYLAFLAPSFCKRRVFWHLCIFLVTAGLVIWQGGIPNTPARSSFAYIVNGVLIFTAVLSTLSLTIWVVEHARLCERFIDELSDKPSRWHQNARTWAKGKNKVARECVDEWLDIQLVAKLTATMQPLIFGPVLCIALLVVARSPVIDDWDIPRGLEIVLATLLLYSILAEVFLQRGAKSARKKAIDLLSNKISIQRNLDEPNDVVIKRIEAEIARIKDLREGAFRPWYEWPLLQSFGGLGSLWVALQYFAGVWGEGSL
ncbi:MAG: hypothetical protein NTV43_02880 [Methylococcales bacterium]|nr:hypothetical protein [Methylococcales bacterium]